MRRRTRLLAMLAATGVAATGLVGIQATPSQAAPRDGKCDSGEFCYYYNSAEHGWGSISDLPASLGSYGTSQPSCYEYKGTGNGKGRCIKNDAGAVHNNTGQPVRVYSGDNYTGTSVLVPAGYKGNLDKLSPNLKNKNASHKPETSTTNPVRGGTINRATVIKRAQYWVDRQPGGYSWTGYSPGPNSSFTGLDTSFNYRRDCSGYVSMSWLLNESRWTGTLVEVSTSISRSSLKAGDILIVNPYSSANGHVILFHKWIDQSKGTFYYYSFGSTPVKYRSGNFNSTIDSHAGSKYEARRYHKIQD